MPRKKIKYGGNKGKTRISYPGQGDAWEPDPKQLEIFEAVERGEKHSALAIKYGVTRGRITFLIGRMRRWKARLALPRIDALQQQQIGRAEWVAGEAAAAWERSKTANQDNIQCLTTYLKAQEQINKILGINAPEKTEVSGQLDHKLQIVQKDDFYGTNPHALPAPADAPPSSGPAIRGPV